MRQQDFYYKNNSGNAAVIIAEPFNRAIGFAADRACIQLDITFAKSDAGDVVINESFFRTSKIEWLWKDGETFIGGLTMKELEYLGQLYTRRWPKDLVGCVVGAAVPGEGSIVQSFYFDVPLEIAVAADPKDFRQSLANFGQFTFTPGTPAIGTPTITVANVQVIISAYGRKVNGMVNGTRVAHRRQASVAPQNTESVSLRGKLLSLMVSGDPTNVIAGTKPKVKIGDRELLNFTNLNVIDVVKHLGPSRWGIFDTARSQTAATTYTAGEIGVLVPPEEGFLISSLPGQPGSMLGIAYDTNAVTAGTQFLVYSEVMPRKDCFTRQVPGADKRSADALEQFIERPTVDPRGVVTDRLLPYLPEIVRTPEVESQLGC